MVASAVLVLAAFAGCIPEEERLGRHQQRTDFLPASWRTTSDCGNDSCDPADGPCGQPNDPGMRTHAQQGSCECQAEDCDCGEYDALLTEWLNEGDRGLTEGQILETVPYEGGWRVLDENGHELGRLKKKDRRQKAPQEPQASPDADVRLVHKRSRER